jgi:lipopolysaccharide transport system permease protein
LIESPGTTARDESQVLVIRPQGWWPRLEFGELWAFRDLLLSLTIRDIKLRYRQTLLGIGWVVLQPLMAAAVLGFVFGRVANLPAQGVPHFAMALVGVLSWTAFSGSLTRSSPAVVQNVSLVSRVFFPRVLLPLSAALASVVDVLIGMVLAVVIVWRSGVNLGAAALSAPLWVLATMLLGLGVGLAAAALMVRFRDVQHMLPFLVQLTLLASPVAYPLAAIPPRYRFLFQLNPLVGLIEGLRWSLLGLPPASWFGILYAVAVTLLVFAAGMLFFRALERGFADAI